MERALLTKLEKWKNAGNRKPLILQGARQVGKTWLVKEFGRRFFDNTVYINFDKDKSLHDTLERTLNPADIILAIEVSTDQKISISDTLIIFDEVQEEPRALTSLKYFCEDAPEYAIIATGSFMGIALHQGTSFPVGKVNTQKLYPMSFNEFLSAIGKEGMSQLLNEKNVASIISMKSMYIDLLRTYYIVGGMPEAVQQFVNTEDYNIVRESQGSILDLYRQDFSKHAEANQISRLNMVWDSIPGQLAKENRKFIYGQLAKGARAKDYELAIMWLSDCGLIHIVHRITKPGYPLKAYEELSAFKIYMNDVGLLGAMANLPPKVILEGNRIFTEFKGALTEQYVLQQFLSTMDMHPYYYSADNSRGEIDFVIQDSDTIIPIEVKAEENLQAKSLRAFYEKYNLPGIRISMSDYREQEWLTNYPLYAFMSLMPNGKIK